MRLFRPVTVLVSLLALLGSGTAFAGEGKQPIDHELEKYWNVELAVPTLDNALYKRAGSFEASLGVGLVPNDSYYLPMPLNVRLGYHVAETVAIELAFSYLLTPKSDLLDFLESPGNGQRSLLDGVIKPPRMTMMGGVDFVYSPFHGKVGVFDKKLSSFDVGLVVGVGMINAEIDTTEIEDAISSQILPAGRWGVALRFFLNPWLTVRADVRQFVYKPEDALLFPVEMTVGLAFLSI